MFNKKLIILILLTIFCIGITISSVSANENLNLTDNINEQSSFQVDTSDELKQINNFDELSDSSYYNSISVTTKDITKYDNPENIKIKLTRYTGSGSYVGVASRYSVYYQITDQNNKVVYYKSATTDMYGMCNFESNYNVFKDLPGGEYTCKLSSTSLKAPYSWSVRTPIGTHNIKIYSGDYTNFKSNSNNLVHVYVNSTHVSTVPRLNYTIKNSKNEIVYSAFIRGNSTICTLESNYNIFKNLPDDSYICSLTSEEENHKFGIVKGNTFTWKVLVDRSIKNTPTKSSTPFKPNHYIKYIKVGKYKVRIWADDSLKVQKQKVLKYLNTHVKNGKTYKFHGFKFKVSKKQYIQILYKNKFKLGAVGFKIKTNKYKTIEVPKYKYKKVRSWSWITDEVKTMVEYYDSNGGVYKTKYYDTSKYYSNGWKTDTVYHYYNGNKVIYCAKFIKKDYNYPTYKYVKDGYKNVKVKVYAIGHSMYFIPHVGFRAIGNGQNRDVVGCYYKLT